MLEELIKPVNIIDNSYLIVVYLVCFTILGIHLYFSDQSLKTSLLHFFCFKNIEQKERDPIARLTIFIVSFIGFLLYLALEIHNINSNYFISDTSFNYKFIGKIFLSGSIFLICYILIKTISLNVLQFIFPNSKERFTDLKNEFLDMFILSGLIFFFLSFLATYSSRPVSETLLLFGRIVLIFIIIRVFITLFKNFSLKTSALYHFFLYLCVFEILPILVFAKYLSTFIF